MILFECCYALRRRRRLDYRWVDRFPRPVQRLLYLATVFVSTPWSIFRRAFDRKPTHVRLRQHIWIGMMSIPAVYLHCGPHWGSAISSVVFVLFMVVVISGIVGLLLQQILPRLLRWGVLSETTYSQIPVVLDVLRRESELLVRATCGPVDFESGSGSSAGFLSGRRPPPLVATIREHFTGHGAGLLEHIPRAPVVGSECLLEFYENQLRPFLADVPWIARPRLLSLWPLRFSFSGNTGALSSPTQARAEYFKLRGKLDPAAHGVVDALERISDRRRQLARQARLHTVLHFWLLFHLPATIALLVTLAAHIYYGIKFLMIIG
jgi:hypothetical protein